MNGRLDFPQMPLYSGYISRFFSDLLGGLPDGTLEESSDESDVGRSSVHSRRSWNAPVKTLLLETEVAPVASAVGKAEPKTRSGIVQPIPSKPPVPELSIVVPCLNEAQNLQILLPSLHSVIQDMDIRAELCVVDGGSSDGTPALARELGARVIVSPYSGYGGALKAAFEETQSPYVITLDADFSHHPSVVRQLFEMRHQADIVIASRYIQGGYARTAWSRKILSRILNLAFRATLSLPVHDLSSGFRLYRRGALASLNLKHSTYAVLQEILTKAYCSGYKVMEIPFHYLPRRYGRSHASLLRFGLDYLSVMREMFRLRTSAASADHETRAFHSFSPLRRFQQRRRYQIILDYIGGRLRVLDVGCGSSQILNGAPQTIGIDILQNKLRFMRRPGRNLINGNAYNLPLGNETFEVVVCSQVTNHLSETNKIYQELLRILEPGGSLIISTTRPRGGGRDVDERVVRYPKQAIIRKLRSFGLDVLASKSIGKDEIIIHARKPE